MDNKPQSRDAVEEMMNMVRDRKMGILLLVIILTLKRLPPYELVPIYRQDCVSKMPFQGGR